MMTSNLESSAQSSSPIPQDDPKRHLVQTQADDESLLSSAGEFLLRWYPKTLAICLKIRDWTYFFCAKRTKCGMGSATRDRQRSPVCRHLQELEILDSAIGYSLYRIGLSTFRTVQS